MVDAKIEQRLTPDELAYHRHLMRQREMADAALDSWSRFLAGKYQLTPDDGISPEGEFIKNARQLEQQRALAAGVHHNGAT